MNLSQSKFLHPGGKYLVRFQKTLTREFSNDNEIILFTNIMPNYEIDFIDNFE